jgi:hypothetical protein
MVTSGSRAPHSKGPHCGVVKPHYCPASESGIRIAVTRTRRLTSSCLLPSCKFDFNQRPYGADFGPLSPPRFMAQKWNSRPDRPSPKLSDGTTT